MLGLSRIDGRKIGAITSDETAAALFKMCAYDRVADP
jgi:hypothetical protein